MDKFYFWSSVISIFFNIILIIGNVWQLSAGRKEKETHKSQVKIWQHHASGLLHGIISIVLGQFSSVKDIQEAAKVSQANAYGLYTSLNEERLFTEEEIKAKQLKTEEEFKKARSVASTGKES
jgi:hypothetical protein